MPFARIDLIQGKSSEYRAAVADIVYRGIVDVLEAPDGDRFVVVGEHTSDNLIYDPTFLDFNRGHLASCTGSSSARQMPTIMRSRVRSSMMPRG